MDLHGIIVVDKPRGPTSHDVVALVRRQLQTKRVGHAGTLDPAAEGVLIVAVGRATKLIDTLQQTVKQYAAHIVLGCESASGDVEGPLIQHSVHIHAPSFESIQVALERFTGEIEQIPPAHSAVKIGGRAAYQFAHQGKDVEVPARRVVIHSIRVLDYAYPDLQVVVDCSAGTYIRALARDVGATLGTKAYLHALLRARSGRFDLADAWALHALRDGLSSTTFSSMALHPDSVLTERPALALDFAETSAWYDGRPVDATNQTVSPDETARVYRSDGAWLGVGVRTGETLLWQPRLVVADRSFRARS